MLVLKLVHDAHEPHERARPPAPDVRQQHPHHGSWRDHRLPRWQEERAAFRYSWSREGLAVRRGDLDRRAHEDGEDPGTHAVLGPDVLHHRVIEERPGQRLRGRFHVGPLESSRRRHARRGLYWRIPLIDRLRHVILLRRWVEAAIIALSRG